MEIDFEQIVRDAENSISQIIANSMSYDAQLENAAYRMMPHVLAVHRAGKEDPKAYDAFLKDRSVAKTERSINPFHPTVAALVAPDVRRRYRQRITLYAQAAFILDHLKVEKITEWFDTEEKIGRGRLTGLAKASAIYKALPHVMQHNANRRKARNNVGEAGIPANQTPGAAFGYFDTAGRFCAVQKTSNPSDVEAVRRLLAASGDESAAANGNEPNSQAA